MGNRGLSTVFVPDPVLPQQAASKAYVDAGGGGSGHVIEDEGTPLTARSKLNFVGAGVTATDDAGDDASVVTIPVSPNSTDFTDRIPLVMEVPEGTIGFPDVRTLATAGAKITGMVLPDGASVSSINLKCNVPNDLAGTPAASIKLIIIGLGVGTADNVRLTVKTRASGDAESVDTAFTSETEATVPIPNAAEVIEIYDQDMTTDPTAGDLLTVQVDRDPTDGSDDYPADIMIIGGYLEIDRAVT